MNKNATEPGKFISFEGGEGTGKSTQATMLVQHLEKSGVKTICTREPGGTEIAEDIRELLVRRAPSGWDPFTEALLHFAARRSHLVETIWPSLKKGIWVVTDRFTDSSMAYQGIAMGLGRETIQRLKKLVVEDFSPDLTLIMDLQVEEGLRRTEKRFGERNRYDEMDFQFHKKVRDGFLEIASTESKRCVVIDSSQSIETIGQNIIDVVNKRFKL